MKTQICWAIFNGNMMLPFTLRETRSQCKKEYFNDIGEKIYIQGMCEGWLSCRKVVVSEYIKDRR